MKQDSTNTLRPDPSQTGNNSNSSSQNCLHRCAAHNTNTPLRLPTPDLHTETTHLPASNCLFKNATSTNQLPTSTSASTFNSSNLSSTIYQHNTPSMFNFLRRKQIKEKHEVDSRDGKTKACDRQRTFESFVDGEQLGVAEKQKKTGHTWEVVRALKGLFGKKKGANGVVKGGGDGNGK